MLLTIDCGNTQTVIGLFADHDLVDHWRIATVAERNQFRERKKEVRNNVVVTLTDQKKEG